MKYAMHSALPHLEVRDTGTARGRGMFAGEDIRQGDLVEASHVMLVHAPWDTIPIEIRKILYSWKHIGGREAPYALALGFGSLFNSSNPANLTFQASPCNQMLLYTAACDIPKGTELVINYNSDSGGVDSTSTWWFEHFAEDEV